MDKVVKEGDSCHHGYGAISVGSFCCPPSFRVHSAADPGVTPPFGLLHRLGFQMQELGFRSGDEIIATRRASLAAPALHPGPEGRGFPRYLGKPVVRLHPHQDNIPVEFGSDIVVLANKPAVLHLPSMPSVLDWQRKPWAVEVKNLGRGVVAIVGKAQFSAQVNVDRTLQIQSCNDVRSRAGDRPDLEGRSRGTGWGGDAGDGIRPANRPSGLAKQIDWRDFRR
jgi:hypothetical protein